MATTTRAKVTPAEYAKGIYAGREEYGRHLYLPPPTRRIGPGAHFERWIPYDSPAECRAAAVELARRVAAAPTIEAAEAILDEFLVGEGYLIEA